jgi:ferric-dicitrate binding protein FerR (iron transport regulator)
MPQGLERYKDMEVIELLDDPVFQKWVRDKDPELATEWQAFLLQFPDREPIVAAARAILEGVDSSGAIVPTPAAREQDFASIQQRLPATPVHRLPHRTRSRSTWWRVAAAIAVIVCLGGIAWWGLPNGAQVYTTASAERMEIELPDGSQVVLNANSRLSLNERNWTESERIVTLDGEAFFTIRPEEDATGALRSFRVETQDLRVAVLGTRFNVHKRRGATRVFLAEGSVRIDWMNADWPAMQLRPGDLVSYEPEKGGPVHQQQTVAERHLAWMSGQLLFNRTPLAEALAEIADIYGIEFSTEEPSLRSRELSSAGIPVDNLEVTLDILEKALDLRIERTGKDSFLVQAGN